MRDMFRTMAEKLSAGEDIVLVSVVASSGATPRGAGARMLVGREGRICGTIGGGAVEYRSEHIAAEVLEEKKSGSHDFSLTKNDVQNLGMICGGDVKVYFRYIPGGDSETLELAAEAERRFAEGHDMWLLSEISDGGRLSIYSAGGGFFPYEPPEWTKELMSRKPKSANRDGREFYAEQINSSGRVYVFGCGHVAQELVPVLAHVGFRCVAMDDRPEFASAELFPSAEEVLLIDFERVADYVDIGPEDYVCIMTRGHAFDTVVQAQALAQFAEIDIVIDIEVSDEALISRISGRRVCPACGATYHVSRLEGTDCEKCGAALIQREDDQPETVLSRLEVYHAQTAPLIDFYAQRGLLKRVDGAQAMDACTEAIFAALGEVK